MSIRSHDCVCSVNLDHGHYYWYCWYRHNLFGITSFHCLSQARYSRCSKAKQTQLAPTPKMALCGIKLVDHNNFETDDIREQKLLWSQHLNPLQAEPSLWRWLQRAAHWSKSSRDQLWWRVCNVWWITVNWNLNELTTKKYYEQNSTCPGIMADWRVLEVKLVFLFGETCTQHFSRVPDSQLPQITCLLGALVFILVYYIHTYAQRSHFSKNFGPNFIHLVARKRVCMCSIYI